MSKSKKNAKNNQNNTKGYSDKTEQQATDSVPQNDNSSHAENKSDRDCQ